MISAHHATTLARAVHRAGRTLSRIRTRQPVYPFAHGVFDDVPIGHRYMPCRLSAVLLRLSMRLDPDHYEHWSMPHGHLSGRCSTSPCRECGGQICANVPPDEEAAE